MLTKVFSQIETFHTYPFLSLMYSDGWVKSMSQLEICIIFCLIFLDFSWAFVIMKKMINFVAQKIIHTRCCVFKISQSKSQRKKLLSDIFFMMVCQTELCFVIIRFQMIFMVLGQLTRATFDKNSFIGRIFVLLLESSSPMTANVRILSPTPNLWVQNLGFYYRTENHPNFIKIHCVNCLSSLSDERLKQITGISRFDYLQRFPNISISQHFFLFSTRFPSIKRKRNSHCWWPS